MLKAAVEMNDSAMPRDEAELIKGVCAGNREAFYELVRPYERLIFAMAISVLRNEADAEEVAQEAVLKAFSNLAAFRGEAKFSTWLVQITCNEARMRLRKERSHLYEPIEDTTKGDEGEYQPRDFADWRPIPSEVLERSEVRKVLRDAINSLGAAYREVLILRDIQGLSIKETAAILSIPEATVKTRLHRARLQLRDDLAPGFDGRWLSGDPYRKVRPW
jgi:RNA polymerase sigma-70 factor, ECF subfamily